MKKSQSKSKNQTYINELSVIVPVYNEEKIIENLLTDVKQDLDASNLKYEIIVVDDGSTDNSYEMISNISGITTLQHEKNIGYGGALKTGIKYSKYDYIAIIDGDGTYPANLIPKLAIELDQYDMIVGTRNLMDKNISNIRKPVKWFMGTLANYLSDTEIPDLNSGLRVFKKDIALKFYKILPSGFSFTTTITLAMHCNNYKVKYIPIKYGKREGKSKFSPISDTLNFLLLILRTVIYFNPLKVFLPLSALLFLFFMIFLIKDIFLLSNLTDKTVFLFIAFIQILAIGLLADLIDKRSS